MRKWIIIIVLVFITALGGCVLMSIRKSGSFELWVEDCLSALMSGDRTAAVLHMEKSQHASLDFIIRSHMPRESYGFDTVDENIDLEVHPIWETQVDITSPSKRCSTG